LFEGSYKVALVNNESYLLHLCRYIHANPVKHGLVTDVAAWPYSNYLEWVGERNGTLVDHDFVQEHFPVPEGYRAFVLDYLRERELPRGLTVYLREWES
jgi:putative transposase